MKRNLYFIKCFLLAIGTSFGLMARLNPINIIEIKDNNNILLTYLIVGSFFFWFYSKFIKNIKKNMIFNVLSIMFSLFLVFGYSYSEVGNATLVNGNVTLIIWSTFKFVSLFYMINTALNLFYEIVINFNLKDKKPLSRLGQLFDKHPFLFCFVTIFLCYLPYLIAYYPGIMCNDPLNQIKEFMGVQTRYMNSVVLRNPDVTITNFNPVIHTLFVGGTFWIGNTLGNNNLGMFIYTLIQTVVMVGILSYAISYMKAEGVNTKFLYIALGIFALVPVFPFYALANVKDTIFSSLIILYTIKLYDIIKYDYTFKKYVYLFIISILVILFRNNGIYTILLSMPFLLIWLKDKRKEVTIMLTLIVLVYVGYGRILLPTLGISDTSIREALSIPFQQTARLVRYHGDEIDDKDKKVINYLLNFETLGERYDPELADPVKNQYNKYADSDALENYFKVWFKYLIKYPVVYVDATIANTYGYFYPNSSNWYIYHRHNERVVGTEYYYEHNGLKPMRDLLTTYGRSFPYIPIIGMFVNIGFVVWIYFTMFGILLVNNKNKYIPVLLPAFSLILVCIASPANTYFRYAQPFIFSLPVVMFLLYGILEKKKAKN